MAAYEPPRGSTTVSKPRLLSDFPQQLAVHYVVSTCAFLQYAFLISPASRFRSRVIQIITLLCFPMLPLIYQCINLVKLGKCVIQHRPQISGLRHAIAGISGQRTGMSPSSEDMVQEYHLLDVDKDHIEAKILPYCSVRYALRTWLLLATMLTVGFHVAFYIGRLNIRYHGATYVAVLGLDHRMGWLAIGSFAATILSLPMHLVNTQWRVRSKADLPTSSSQGYRVIVLAAVFAAIVQDILLTLTNRLSAFGVFGLRRTLDLRFLCACLALVIAFKFRRWVPRSATTVVVFAWLLLVAMLQLVYDIKEVMEIHGELYHPWNYRWAVKTPPWRA